ncbi:hypothetical protein [Chryseolinea lacunae]|uniref:Uncharacterized protein n=1 Tax=Chryseolinea lacunae TaxID=2801331 RepID=A0ABS1KKW6_9BACT|nr:hypothetical protein [Chryseolinea lacunae]MBL0740109.1 hypothetical protein [Chryseolinea lacunae]
MNISEKWGEIIRDMEGDDTVLEIKVTDAGLDKQNALLKFLTSKKCDVKYFYAGQEKDLPTTVGLGSFLSSESEEIVIDLLTCKLYYHFNAVNEMEFYTDSVLHLNDKEAAPIFEFIHQLGSFINSKIHLHIESYPNDSYAFDPNQDTKEPDA